MDRTTALRVIGDDWLCFIMRGDTEQETLEVLSAVVSAGARVVEVPFTTPNAPRVIADLRARHGGTLMIAAGTVMTVDQVSIAVESGANAIVSPMVHRPIIVAALRAGMISVAGCMTPTEIASAGRAGADILKIFPADIGGPTFIASMLGPFPGIRLMPSGSVTRDSWPAYHRAGAYAAVVGVGSEMGVEEAIREGRLATVAEQTRTWLRTRDAILAGKEEPQAAAAAMI